MSENSLTSKIASPYVNALIILSIKKKILNVLVKDFQNLEDFIDDSRTTEFIEWLDNPLVNRDSKMAGLEKIFESQVSEETLRFLLLLVLRNRTKLLKSIVSQFLTLSREVASFKIIEISTASPLTDDQISLLTKKLKKLTKGDEIYLDITVDSGLIGGFLLKLQSQIIDFTVKNQLQRLAKHLNTALEI